MKKQGIFFNGITAVIFMSMLVYLLLRAYYVEPIHDEAATFFHFIESGHIMDDQTLLDANNHLLNSYLGRGIYKICGLNFFLFRLPSVLSFCLYFWAARKLTQTFRIEHVGFLVFIALLTIPWITDYFSYTRGYGMAISFFMAALVFLDLFINKRKLLSLTLLLGLSWLSVFANFTYLVSALLMAAFAAFAVLFNWRKWSPNKLLTIAFLFVVFISALLPLISFCLKLKEAGALYYGSLDGLWWVTGKTLSLYVLFFDADWLRYVYMVFGLLAVWGSWITLRKVNFKELFWQPLVQWGFLLAGNIAAILFLAKVFQVNYPEDRAAMYLVPLSLLSAGYLISTFSFGKYVAVIFLFFPITFLFQLNLNTSVFSPDDRMSNRFYKKVKSELDSNDALALHPIMQLTWSLHERKHGANAHIGQPMKGFFPQFNIILTKNTIFKNEKEYPGYTVFAEDPASTYIALKRTKKLYKKLLFQKNISSYYGRDEYITLLQDSIHVDWKNRMLGVNVDAQVLSPKHMNTLNVVFTTEDESGQPNRFHYQNVRWYVGENAKNCEIHFPLAENNLNDRDKLLKVYLWNPDKRPIHLRNGSVKVNALN